MTSEYRYHELKSVTLDAFTLGIPTGWQVHPLEDEAWWCGDPQGLPGLFLRSDRPRPPDWAATTEARIAAFVDDIRVFLQSLDVIEDITLEPISRGTLVRAVLAFDDESGATHDVRWYLVVDVNGIAIFRYRLVIPAVKPRPPELAELVKIFDDQTRRARVAETPDGFQTGRIHAAPPAGSYDSLRTTNIDGVVEFRVPERWKRQYEKKDFWWFYDPEVVGSMFVTYSARPLGADPGAFQIGESLEASAYARLHSFARPSMPENVETFAFDNRVLARGIHDDPVDNEPEERLHNIDWHLGCLCGDVFVFAMFRFMVPISLAEAPAFRELVEILDAEIRTARLAPPKHKYPSSPTLDERKYHLDELKAEIILDGNLCLCVPKRWNWIVDDEGAAFDDKDEADGEETGTLWIDYAFCRYEKEPTEAEKIDQERKARTKIVDTVFPYHRVVVAPKFERTEDGFRVWRTYDAWSEGEMLRFVRCDRFLWRPEGRLLLFFSFVLPVVMADDPEMVELCDIVVREVNLAWIA